MFFNDDMRRLSLLLIIIAVNLWGYGRTDEKYASFYGASYIHLPVQEAKGATDISFRFRTSSPDAMLLLAAGKTDYCLIKLETGRLKVHINLGAGESELMSERGLILNDLNWHEVNLTRREANLTLQIDVIHVKRLLLPGRYFELNIQYGVFIGGQGDFNDFFLGHIDHLRGCLADIMYNGINVIEYAKWRKSQSEVTAVTWGCSLEFNATRNEDISFVEDGAFAIIRRSLPRSGSSWTFELRTIAEKGLLFYNVGKSSHADFLGIELYESKVRLLMNKGNGPTELIHEKIVADGQWHRVIVKFSPNDIGISIDEKEKTIQLPSGGNIFLDLTDTLYIGGTELNKRARALGRGLKSGDVSLKGCLKSMLLENQKIGLPDIKISQGIVSRCVWKFPCVEDRPCIDAAPCHQLGVSSFKCICSQSTCVRSDYAENYTIGSNANLPVELEIVSLSPLSVFEGESAVVNGKNLGIVLDIAKYGVEENGVIFTLALPPSYGTLTLDYSFTRSENSFTLQDVNLDKIRYIHDGSETTKDKMILDLTLIVGSGYVLPNYLEGRLGFTLHVNVTPVNDPPILEIPAAKVLRLAQATKKTLSKDLIWALDPDTTSDRLVYTVLRTDTDAGHVEKVMYPSQPIDTFTQAELVQGSIAYLHHGNVPNAMLGLQVNDGIASSEPAQLRVSAYTLQIKMTHNTGLIVVHQSFSYLTSANLSFATNSDETGLEIKYEIVSRPKYGNMEQLKKPTNVWTMVEHFTSRDLQEQSIRYVHKHGTPTKDEFKFYARVREIRTQQAFDFRINFIDLELKEMKNLPINFTDKSEFLINSQYLKYQTNPLASDTSTILYTLKSKPKYGNLILKTMILTIGDRLTQEDIDSNKLKYRLYRKSYSVVEEELKFRIAAPQCTDRESTLELHYQPSSEFSISANSTLEILKVEEGSKVRINSINDYGVASLIYNLTIFPNHGWLLLIKNQTHSVNVTDFTNEQLKLGQIIYLHDDSETKKDSFEYVSSSLTSDFMYIGRFRIEIMMKNDNPPKRTTRKIFQIVTNGERIIRNEDLSFDDEDIETKAEKLLFTIKNKINIGVYKIHDPLHQIRKFSQKDINDGQILLRHQSNATIKNVKLEFSITDGQFFTDDVLEIQASSAYVLMKNNQSIINGTIVRVNESVVLRADDFDIESNVYVTNETQIEYEVTDRPKYGILIKDNREIVKFNRKDLTEGDIFYKNNNATRKDNFQFKVSLTKKTIGRIVTEGRFFIKIYPEIYWERLTVKNNRTIIVEESTSILLSRKNIEIIHPKISSAEILYLIKKLPNYGYLELQNHDDHTEEINSSEYTKIQSFEQSLIDEGRLFYVQSITNQSNDRLIVDVTNGVTWLRDLYIYFVIVPDKIYIESKLVQVVEGETTTLGDKDFLVLSPYYAGKLTDYKIVVEPRYGSILDTSNNSSQAIREFSQKQLSNGLIGYKHNGAETIKDFFKIVATVGEKDTEPFNVFVQIEPVNDEKPILVSSNRTEFIVWQGGSVILNSSYLMATDLDNSPVDVTFGITRVRNGFFSFVDRPSMDIYTFSQEFIQLGRVMFTHTNGTDADFSFVLHDGVHTTNTYTVPVMTKPVKITNVRNEPLNVFPLMKKFISSTSLSTTCSDETRQLKYMVKSPPRLGKIIVETSEDVWLESNRFTQKDIDNNKVMYEHTRSSMDLRTNDSFIFDVEAHFSRTLPNQIFAIDISISSGGLDRYVNAKEVYVTEGGSSELTINVTSIVGYLRSRAGIANPDVQLKLIRQPNHGHVMLKPDLNITTFTQSEMESGEIGYFHDNSDTLEDRIEFSLYLIPTHILLVNGSIRVVVKPINDMNFKRITGSPSINVVQNQNQTITRSNLLTIDPDTPAEDIVYDVITVPIQGRLLLLDSRSSNTTKDEVHRVDKFTQRDIDSNRLIYEHNGLLQADSFYFRVSDGHFNPDYDVLHIHVSPIRLKVMISGPILLRQGSTNAPITVDNIKLDTNVRQELISYRITNNPKHGVVYTRDSKSITFKHTDLLSKVVIYMQTDMTASNDSIELSALVRGFEQNNICIEIKVTPLMTVNQKKMMIALAGEKNRIDLKYLDATPLAELSKSNPIYTIVKKPKYSKVKRIIKSSSSSSNGDRRTIREKEISRFTHEEIVSGVIYLVCKKISTMSYEGIPDNFHFILLASVHQPAFGQFDYKLKLDLEDDNMTLGGPMDPVGHEGEMTIAPNMSNDYLLVLGMLMGVFLLGVVVIITIRCRHNRYKHAMDEEDDKIDANTVAAVSNLNSGSVIPLPRPPDHLMPATPHLKTRFTNEDNCSLAISTPLPSIIPTMTSSTLPQCKVIPLSTLDNINGNGSEDMMDIPSRYPYGIPDGDEWSSSFDTSDLPSIGQSTMGIGSATAGPQKNTNPLLRRNQYWV